MTDTSEPQIPAEANTSEGTLRGPVDVAKPQTEDGVSLLENLIPSWIAWFVVIVASR